MALYPEVTTLIPHRPPFLWVDRILSFTGKEISTVKKIPENLPVFAGHYPGNPLLPGVLLCEVVFQSGAVLMALRSEQGPRQERVPVLTRIQTARFKRPVHPGDHLQVSVHLSEELAGVAFFKGNIKVAGRTVLQVEFSCAMAAVSTADR